MERHFTMSQFFIILLLVLSACQPMAKETGPQKETPRPAQTMREIDEYCLRKAYPQITGFRPQSDGNAIIELANGISVPYDNDIQIGEPLTVSIRQSLAQPYPLEPARPDTPAGFAPGRRRPYALLSALYGDSRQAVASNLVTVDFMGKSVRLSRPAANALERVIQKLRQANFPRPELLHTEGGFAWRKIAGENAQSAHSYGIAIDLSAKHAPYWRWSKKMPHPLQKTYPAEIVKAFEEEGFIWGGKWHEYDLMHFEYRPELICKARLAISPNASR